MAAHARQPDPVSAAAPARLEAVFLPRARGRVHRQGQGQRTLRVILWLWTTNYYLRHAYTVLDAWGYEAKTILTWAKDRFGNGDWLRSRTEHCLLAVRGKPVVT